MVSRRDLTGLIGAGAAVGTLVAATRAASAQSGPQSTFDRVIGTKVLRIGAVPNSAPWWTKDQSSGKWGGQFNEISKALASDIEVELKLVETGWGSAILDLQSDKIDVMFGLNPTPKRALAIDFTGTVYDSALVIIARKGFEPKLWTDMNKPDVRIAVDLGSAHDQIATHLCPKAQISRFHSIEEATMAIRSGRADAQSIFWMGAVRAVKQDPSIGKVIVPQPMFGSTSNAGVRREAVRTWCDFLNTWIVYARGMGVVRDAVVTSLAQVGISLDDIPPGVTL
jgi:polar amino acid transport system substrate-binding protein